jgi:hypothetical protein
LSCSVHSSHLQSQPQSSLSFWGAAIPIVQNKLDLNFLSYSIDWEENPVPQARGRFSLRKVRCFAFLSGGFHKSYGECRLSQDRHIISNTSRTLQPKLTYTKSGKHGKPTKRQSILESSISEASNGHHLAIELHLLHRTATFEDLVFLARRIFTTKGTTCYRYLPCSSIYMHLWHGDPSSQIRTILWV